MLRNGSRLLGRLTSPAHFPRVGRMNLFCNLRRDFTNGQDAAPKKKGLKALMQTYGWSALAVYMAISAIDLPLCYFGVHSLGEKTIKVYMNRLKNVFDCGKEEHLLISEIEILQEERERIKQTASGESIWRQLMNSNFLTEFLIAYGIHKSLVFIRVPITAAATPAIVKALQHWGFNIGKLKKVASKADK
ncbi:AFR475Cp [Eremothecium gossypii ATCC 10895]|uniref:AFR475Cp n=1 Tax=Eremothecium gossypii (strain ATCC 10895 / CBS 109.51 / FGSC 9923 / NRRL Y-1056) TaxID=284811 RepID=Q752U8_EREGS|nr:AFR475Cp [Eremothecium gossypii ATCC 10895]AAS53846.1 AFR475Cp [Eremothecium gossypii ATCC 10895]AEY98159.1 FAFR475Cp [Eremothecium gossypii FDAG1]